MFGLNRKPIDKPEGFIYIASNQSMPGILKIGMTYKNPSKRLEELYTTGVPSPFVLVYQCRVPDRRAAEHFLHDFFSDKRVSKNREFFAVSAKDAVKITRSRVANKKINYKKPASKFEQFVVIGVVITVGLAALYKTGYINGPVNTVAHQFLDFLSKLYRL